MNWIRKIAPYLLLSVFSLTTLHAVFPHAHHVHDLAHSHETNFHNHEEHHHHDASDHSHQELENESKSAFEFFLEFHSHGTDSQPNFTHSEVVFTKKQIKDQYRHSIYIDDELLLVELPQKHHSIYATINKRPLSPLLNTISPRGPPSLV